MTAPTGLARLLSLIGLVFIGYGAPILSATWRGEPLARLTLALVCGVSLAALLFLLVRARTTAEAGTGLLALMVWCVLLLSSWARWWGT
jgi:hypothetical protein